MKSLVFLVDDDEEDRMLLREALEGAAPEAAIVEARDGTELLSLLAWGEGTYLMDPLPDLIVLDMNMPKMNGLEALRKIRAAPLLGDIPAVMLSTSSNPDLIEDALAQGVDAYLIKPRHFDEYGEIARSLVNQYLTPAR